MSIENRAKTYPNLRTMNWIEIIDKAFHLYRNYFRLFIAIALIYFTVDLLHNKLFQLLWENNPYGLVERLISDLISELTIGVLVIATSEIYFQRQITIINTFQRFINIYPRYILSLFIFLIPLLLPLFIVYIMAEVRFITITLFTTVSVLIYIVTFYFRIKWCLYAPSIVVEGSQNIKPIRRSCELIRKAWWRVCGTILTLSILLRAISLIFVVSFVLLLGSFGLMGEAPLLDILEYVLRSNVGFYSGDPPPFDSKSTPYAILMTWYTVIEVLTKPLYAITITLIYFNQRVRREGFDIEMAASRSEALHL